MNLYKITEDCSEWQIDKGEVMKGDLIQIEEITGTTIGIKMIKNNKYFWIMKTSYLKQLTFIDLWKKKRGLLNDNYE